MNDERPKASAGQSSERAAERSVHRLLTRALRDDAVPDAASCLDAETVAAWMDGALAADLRAAAEGHAAGCARCQAVLAAMARTAPPAAPRSWWPASLTIRWLVPAAAAVTAAALLILVSPADDRSSGTTALSTETDRVAGTPRRWRPHRRSPRHPRRRGGGETDERGFRPTEAAPTEKEFAKSVGQAAERFQYRRDRAESRPAGRRIASRTGETAGGPSLGGRRSPPPPAASTPSPSPRSSSGIAASVGHGPGA